MTKTWNWLTTWNCKCKKQNPSEKEHEKNSEKHEDRNPNEKEPVPNPWTTDWFKLAGTVWLYNNSFAQQIHDYRYYMILLHVYSSCQIVFSCDDNSRYQTYRHYCDWHRQKIKLTGSQPLAHPTAEPVEILITRLPQKIESVGPTHHKHLKHHYFPEIFRAQAPRFYFGALHGVLISSSRLPKKDVIVIVTCPTSCSAGVMTVVELRYIKMN